MNWAWLALQLAPVCFAGACALVLGELRESGELAGWSGLGYGPVAMLGGLIPLIALGLALQFGMPGAGTEIPDQNPALLESTGAPMKPSVRAALELPPAVPERARRWPGQWTTNELAVWSLPPAQLSWSQLFQMRSNEAPPGARTGVYSAELGRRATWLLAWPLAALLGVASGRRVTAHRRNQSTLSPAGAGLLASLGLLGFLLAGLIASVAMSAVV